MYKVKTFGTEMKMFHAHEEMERLDEQVNSFFADKPRAQLLGVSDMAVTDEKGATIGMVRVAAYKD